MSIRIMCPGCKGVLMCGEESRGKKMRCKKCQTIFAIPAGSKPAKEPAKQPVPAAPIARPVASDDPEPTLPLQPPPPPPKPAPVVMAAMPTVDFDSPTDLDLESLQSYAHQDADDHFDDLATPGIDDEEVLSVLLEEKKDEELPVMAEEDLDYFDERPAKPAPPPRRREEPEPLDAIVEEEDELEEIQDEVIEEAFEDEVIEEEVVDAEEEEPTRGKKKSKKAACEARPAEKAAVAGASFGQRFRYRFDTFMAKGGVSIFLALVILFSVLFVIFTVVRGLVFLWLGGAAETNDDFWAELFRLFLQLTDPGAIGEDKESGPVYKFVAILAGFSGVLVVSMLIAFITTALDQRLQQLKKGTSKVIENGHTLILGWNERVVEILRELVEANESESNPCVVILSEQDKEAMDDYLRLQLPERKNTRVVTRTGGVSALVNLELVSITTCKSVIILANCSDSVSDEEKAASDIRALKTLLGVMASKPGDTELDVVLELFDQRSQQIARDISPAVRAVNANEILAKVLVQTSRSVGLSVVYAELMSFVGAEMYFHHEDWPEITFGQLQFHFADGIVLGLRHASGKIMLNPPADTLLAEDDDIIILAEDDSAIDFRSKPVVKPRELPLPEARQSRNVEHELIIGWNAKAALIITEYADYLLEGSTIDVLHNRVDDAMRGEIEELQKLANVRVSLIEKDPMKAETLDGIDPTHYDNVLILSAGGANADPETTDSETIVILLLLRQIIERKGGDKKPKLISEVMDSRNQELIARAGVNDFIISNRLVSMLLAQISEQGDIQAVYDDLFSEEGSEIYLKPASLYFANLPVQVSFADIMRSAQKRGEVCLGVKVKALERDQTKNFGVKLNPPKDMKYQLQPDDCLVVLAENET